MIYQMFNTVFHYISKHLEFCPNAPLNVVFSIIYSLFGYVMKYCCV